MPPSRTSLTDLSRLLESSSQPVYVLDDQRRIVFANRACGDWLGCAVGDLLEQECRYSSSAELQGVEALAATLAPPPEVYAGRRMTARLTLPVQDSAEGHPTTSRLAEFIPLAGEGDDVAGVMVCVAGYADDDPRSTVGGDNSEPSPADLHARLQRLRRELKDRYSVGRLMGDSPAMRRVRTQVQLAATGSASVLIVGLPGSGREHAARAIHYGRAAAGSYVPLACPLLGAELLQASVRTLARAHVTGAKLGTLFLADVESLSTESQAELAGFLLNAELPFRLIATAREPLTNLAARGTFREDLACLMSALVIHLPPLSDRLADLPLLAQMFLEEVNARGEKQLGGFTDEALDLLVAYHWPGQVAELAEMVDQAHTQSEGPKVTAADLPRRIHLAAEAARFPRRTESTIVLEEFLGQIERELIERAFAQAKGNKTKAARLLGMTRPRLYRRLVQLGMAEADEAEGGDAS
jgi:transcriptional regulator with PAS, ATPase and Fis domain